VAIIKFAQSEHLSWKRIDGASVLMWLTTALGASYNHSNEGKSAFERGHDKRSFTPSLSYKPFRSKLASDIQNDPSQTSTRYINQYSLVVNT
jgi:hypothetical protein